MKKLIQKLIADGPVTGPSRKADTPDRRIAPDGERRGSLELNRDRSQHRRYTSRYEDMLN
jgi:hypothetical protein